MLCYRDQAYCIKICATENCPRNTLTIDREHFIKVGLGLSFVDFSGRCGEFKPRERGKYDFLELRK